MTTAASAQPSRQVARLQRVARLRVERAQRESDAARRAWVARSKMRDAQREAVRTALRDWRGCIDAVLRCVSGAAFQPEAVPGFRAAANRLEEAHDKACGLLVQRESEVNEAEAEWQDARARWARERGREDALERLHKKLAKAEFVKQDAIAEMLADEALEAARRG
jgi:hypothetical protein